MNEDTAKHVINDLQATPDDSIRFFVRLGGCSTVQDGFSLGITKDTPKHPAAELTMNEQTFFIEEEDEWFFDGNDLTVSVKNGEIQYDFHNTINTN
ncbi:HesB/YadR/YfhF family protein [Fictibacillus sp. UD]|uniref:HesB/YadR/YfhF family protein n=1 Tax=unclassified Fictibacillus TaxID=2644029 RepID=UPI003749CD2A